MLHRRKERGRTCEPLDTKPVLYTNLEPTWRAFWVLSNSRSYSEMGATPIRISDVKAYIDLFITRDREAFVTNICLLDLAYLKYSKEKLGESEDEQENE